tara:strand:- start:52 stop:276 length:225 start_codon:yes stop_codon:yes gene_type:complete
MSRKFTAKDIDFAKKKILALKKDPDANLDTILGAISPSSNNDGYTLLKAVLSDAPLSDDDRNWLESISGMTSWN